jgi:hypothetical protein
VLDGLGVMEGKSNLLRRPLFIEIQRIMFEKKPLVFKSPDLSKLKEVIIDHRTKIYIDPGADIEEAKNRYLSRITTRRTK